MRAAIILLSTLAVAACNMAGARQSEEDHGSREMARRSYDVGAFQSISLGGSHNVIVRVGPAVSVRAEGETRELDRLEIRVENGSLKIGSKNNDGFRFSFRHSKPVTIYVTTPSLAAVAVGGSGDVQVDRVEGTEFAASVGGSGDIQIGRLRVGSSNFSVAGSGDIRASGTSGKTSISVAGSGDIDLGDVESRNASVSVAGSGDVRARAVDTAEVSLVGSGDVTIIGPARCSISKRGSGEVHCEA